MTSDSGRPWRRGIRYGCFLWLVAVPATLFTLNIWVVLLTFLLGPALFWLTLQVMNRVLPTPDYLPWMHFDSVSGVHEAAALNGHAPGRLCFVSKNDRPFIVALYRPERDFLLQKLTSSDPYDRFRATVVLGRMRPSDLNVTLEPLLQDTHEWVRDAAAAALKGGEQKPFFKHAPEFATEETYKALPQPE